MPDMPRAAYGAAMKPGARLLLSLLWDHARAGEQTPKVWPSRAYLARALGCDERTVRAYAREIERAGWAKATEVEVDIDGVGDPVRRTGWVLFADQTIQQTGSNDPHGRTERSGRPDQTIRADRIKRSAQTGSNDPRIPTKKPTIEPTIEPPSSPPESKTERSPLADASTGDLFSAFSPSQTEDQTHAASGTRTRLESTDVDDRGQSAAPTHSESKRPAESKSAPSANGVRKWTREQVLEGEADGWQRRKGQQPPEALVDLLAECWAAAVDPHASDKQRARRARGAGARAEIAAALAGTQRRRGEPPSSALRQLEGMTASEWLMGRAARGDGTRYDAPRYAFRAQHASAALEAWERHGGPVDPRTGEPLVRGESGASVQIATGSSRDEWGDNTPEAYGWGAAGPFRQWRTYDRPAFVREGRNVERHLADLAARRAEGVEPDPAWIEEDLERARHWDRHGLRWWREQGYDPPRPSWMADEDEDEHEEDTQAARRGEEAA